MIVEVTTTKPIDVEQLSEEFGAPVLYADGVVRADVAVTYTGETPDLDPLLVAELQAAVDAHTPDPDYRLPEDEIQQLHDGTKDKATWDALTNAQRQEAIRRAIQLLIKVIRFIYRRLL